MQSKKSGLGASVSSALLVGLVSWLAAFALPASANGSKTISLSVTPTTLSTTTTVVYAKITNTGNSTANSFEVDWKTSPYFTVISATAGGSVGSCSTAGRKGAGYSGCVFTKQLPVKTSVTITLTVTVTAHCDPLSINWFAYAWTGAPGPVSQSFQLNCSIPVTTSPATSCSVKFVTQPADAFISSTITSSPLNSTGAPVTVQLLQNGVAAAAGTAVSLSASPSTCATGTTPVTTDASGTAQVTFSGAAAGACVLAASASGYGSASSQQFNVVQQVGDLGCVSNNTFGTTSASGLELNATRLLNADDPAPDAVGGSEPPACEDVPYVVSSTCPDDFSGSCTNFVYDPLHQGTHMAFAFHWEWPLEDIPNPGGIGAIVNTEQLFLNGNPLPVELDFCSEIVPEFAEDGTFIGLADGSPSPPDQEPAINAPGTQAGCLVRRTVKQVGNQIQIVEDAYVQGDYAARRN